MEEEEQGRDGSGGEGKLEPEPEISNNNVHHEVKATAGQQTVLIHSLAARSRTANSFHSFTCGVVRVVVVAVGPQYGSIARYLPSVSALRRAAYRAHPRVRQVLKRHTLTVLRRVVDVVAADAAVDVAWPRCGEALRLARGLGQSTDGADRHAHALPGGHSSSRPEPLADGAGEAHLIGRCQPRARRVQDRGGDRQVAHAGRLRDAERDGGVRARRRCPEKDDRLVPRRHEGGARAVAGHLPLVGPRLGRRERADAGVEEEPRGRRYIVVRRDDGDVVAPARHDPRRRRDRRAVQEKPRAARLRGERVRKRVVRRIDVLDVGRADVVRVHAVLRARAEGRGAVLLAAVLHHRAARHAVLESRATFRLADQRHRRVLLRPVLRLAEAREDGAVRVHGGPARGLRQVGRDEQRREEQRAVRRHRGRYSGAVA